VTQGPYSKNVGSRLYLLDSSSNKYEKLQLLNKEFTFDVKVSDLDCGLNGALYLVEMDADGGMSHSGKNNGSGMKSITIFAQSAPCLFLNNKNI
jgi:cellulose 1,4-beta-cellobiosidase